MKKLTDLPNIGKVLAEKLQAVGIYTHEELVETGSIQALLKIKNELDDGCCNMLYALEGAIQEVRWHHLPQEVKKQLKAELDKVIIRL